MVLQADTPTPARPETPHRTQPTVPAVKVLEAAIHVLGYRGEGLVLSDRPLDLTPPVRELFSASIARGMQSEAARLARFNGEGSAQSIAVGILDGSTGFLEGSRDLASQLFRAMQGKSGSSGDLAVIRAEDSETGQELLALLKLDLLKGLRREVARIEGETVVRLTPVSDLAPEADRRIQKCAFIPAPPHEFPYDLVVVDHQTGRKDAPGAAGFFVGDFLACELLEGPRELTRKLTEETERWLQDEGVSPTVAIQARQAVVNALHEPEVDLQRVAAEAFHEPERQERFLDHLDSSGLGRTFTPDARAADRCSSSLTYLLDNGVRITGDAEAVAALLQVDTDPDEEGRVQIVIQTFRFERKY